MFPSPFRLERCHALEREASERGEAARQAYGQAEESLRAREAAERERDEAVEERSKMQGEVRAQSLSLSHLLSSFPSLPSILSFRPRSATEHTSPSLSTHTHTLSLSTQTHMPPTGFQLQGSDRRPPAAGRVHGGRAAVPEGAGAGPGRGGCGGKCGHRGGSVGKKGGSV
jgi:hypothetical protein